MTKSHDLDCGHSHGQGDEEEAPRKSAAAPRSHPSEPQAPSVGQWRPIESAPTDGTSILACWMNVADEPMFGVIYWEEASDYRGEATWVEADQPVANMTHWMPLPAPPTETGK